MRATKNLIKGVKKNLIFHLKKKLIFFNQIIRGVKGLSVNQTSAQYK